MVLPDQKGLREEGELAQPILELLCSLRVIVFSGERAIQDL